VALIVAGILVGPHGFGLLEDQTQISMLADLGIILLMFSIGLDFDRDPLLELRRADGVGFWQIAFCMVVVFGLHKVVFAVNWEKSLFYGMLVSHTSSTLMLKIYGERGEVSTAPARLGLGVSITQDLASVPMLISLPFLAYGGELREVLLSPKI